MSESKYFHVNGQGQLVRLATLPDVFAALTDGGYVWLDFCSPDRADVEALIEPLGLHPLAVEDCFDDEQIPKVEDFPKHSFILFNSFHYADRTLTVSELDLFIGQNFLVSVSRSGVDEQPVLRNIGHIVELDMANARKGPAFLAHLILDWVVDQKFVAIEALEDDLNATEDVILEDHVHFVPSDLVRLRRQLLTLRKCLFHEREILVRISRQDCQFIPENAVLYYRDIYDHLSKCFELIESSRDLVTSLMEMYLSMLNNQMAMLSNDTNVTVRRLTFITTIFMPLTLLAGIGGMSEWSMMTGPENWRVAYPLFLLLMAVLGVVNYYFLKWIERRRNRKELERAPAITET